MEITDIKEGLNFIRYSSGLEYKFALLVYFISTIPIRLGFNFKYDKEIISRIKDIKFIFKSCSSELYSSKEIFIDKMYEQFPGFELKNQNVVLDIGANIGLYSLWASKNNGRCSIYSFEPNPDTYSRLERNIKLNDFNNIFPYQLAVASQTGLSHFRKCQNTWVSGITSSEAKDTIEVKTISLDEFVNDNSIDLVDLIKIDVEGSEFSVLKGSINTLKITRRVILEYHSKELQRNCLCFLRTNGFEVVYEKPLIYDIGTVYCVNNVYSSLDV